MASTPADFIRVCSRDELKPNVPQTFEVDERFVLVIATDNGVYCIEDLCTHDGGSFEGGEFDGKCIACPRHGAKFDIASGEAVCMPATEPTPTHEVKVEAGQVYIRIAAN